MTSEPDVSRRHDVAIVGYGPVGALLAGFLARAGHSVAVFEREAAAYALPRAVHFDGEVMRIFQNAGVGPAMAAVTRASTRGMHFVNAEGRTLMIRRGMEGIGPMGWHNNHYFHQPDLERVLREGAESTGRVAVAHQAEVITVEDAGDHARLGIRRADGRTEQHTARYVVGCDGVRSLVFRLIGAKYDDLGFQQKWLVSDFIMKGPAVDLPRLPDYTVQHCDPARPMTACYVTGQRRRWEMMLKAEDDPEAFARPDNVWKIVSRWATPADATLERAAIYTFRSVIARGWRRGRLMIAGDAAHQTPPFIGQGMCAGIRDVGNLAWKLDFVLRGLAGDGLLDTYESERWPHVHAFIGLAVKVGAVIQAEGAEAAERDRRFASGSPELFSYPDPQLGPGAHADAARPAAVVFPQPSLADGRRLDDAAGPHFAVVGRRAVIEAARTEAGGQWSGVEAVVIDEPGDAIERWLDENHAAAVILRPDRYVFGVARDAAGLAELSRELPARCQMQTTH